MGDAEETLDGTYPLPEEPARHVPKSGPPPTSRAAGEGLGREDARKSRIRTASQMVAMWRGLKLPAREAPYGLRDAKMGL
jgi:hypothetical protein